MKPQWKCANCRKVFKAYLRGGGAKPRFCSRSCAASWGNRNKKRRTIFTVRCGTCDTEFQGYRRSSGKPPQFCSQECYHVTKRGKVPAHLEARSHATGPNSPHWKGGRLVDTDGYVRLRFGSRYFMEHRVVVEKHLGRRLSRGEVVHHKNGDRKDNRLENLEVLTRAEHARLHLRAAWDAVNGHRRSST